ncbi:MAG: hypothetical protein ACYSTZ_02245, partial [Planctomycetota bacterium]
MTTQQEIMDKLAAGPQEPPRPGSQRHIQFRLTHGFDPYASNLSQYPEGSPQYNPIREFFGGAWAGIESQIFGGPGKVVKWQADKLANRIDKPFNWLPQVKVYNYVAGLMGQKTIDEQVHDVLPAWAKGNLRASKEQTEALGRAGKKYADWWDKQAAEGWEAPAPGLMQERWNNPISYGARVAGSAVPSVAMVVTSAALTGSPAPAMAMMSLGSGAQAYEQQREAGGGFEKANAIGSIVGMTEMLTENIALGKIFDPSIPTIKKFIVAPTYEGLQEVAQGMSEGFFGHFGYNAKKPGDIPVAVKEGFKHIFDQWSENLVAGMAMGEMTAAGMAAFEKMDHSDQVRVVDQYLQSQDMLPEDQSRAAAVEIVSQLDKENKPGIRATLAKILRQKGRGLQFTKPLQQDASDAQQFVFDLNKRLNKIIGTVVAEVRANPQASLERLAKSELELGEKGYVPRDPMMTKQKAEKWLGRLGVKVTETEVPGRLELDWFGKKIYVQQHFRDDMTKEGQMGMVEHMLEEVDPVTGEIISSDAVVTLNQHLADKTTPRHELAHIAFRHFLTAAQRKAFGYNEKLDPASPEGQRNIAKASEKFARYFQEPPAAHTPAGKAWNQFLGFSEALFSRMTGRITKNQVRDGLERGTFDESQFDPISMEGGVEQQRDLTPEEEYDEWLAYMHSEEYAIEQDDQDALAENVSRIGEMRERRDRAEFEEGFDSYEQMMEGDVEYQELDPAVMEKLSAKEKALYKEFTDLKGETFLGALKMVGRFKGPAMVRLINKIADLNQDTKGDTEYQKIQNKTYDAEEIAVQTSKLKALFRKDMLEDPSVDPMVAEREFSDLQLEMPDNVNLLRMNAITSKLLGVPIYQLKHGTGYSDYFEEVKFGGAFVPDANIIVFPSSQSRDRIDPNWRNDEGYVMAHEIGHSISWSGAVASILQAVIGGNISLRGHAKTQAIRYFHESYKEEKNALAEQHADTIARVANPAFWNQVYMTHPGDVRKATLFLEAAHKEAVGEVRRLEANLDKAAFEQDILKIYQEALHKGMYEQLPFLRVNKADIRNIETVRNAIVAAVRILGKEAELSGWTKETRQFIQEHPEAEYDPDLTEYQTVNIRGFKGKINKEWRQGKDNRFYKRFYADALPGVELFLRKNPARPQLKVPLTYSVVTANGKWIVKSAKTQKAAFEALKGWFDEHGRAKVVKQFKDAGLYRERRPDTEYQHLPAELINKETGVRAIVGPSAAVPGKWQLTFISPEGEPISHQTYRRPEDAILRAELRGYQVVGPKAKSVDQLIQERVEHKDPELTPELTPPETLFPGVTEKDIKPLREPSTQTTTSLEGLAEVT